MISTKLSFVLPTTLKENLSKVKWRRSTDKYKKLRFELLIRTFIHNFNFQNIDKFLIVCPKGDIYSLNVLLRNLTSDKRFIILDEEEVVPEFKDNPSISGWYKQQIIKLAIAKHIKTDYYLTLDDDVFCNKYFSYSDLFFNNKAYVNTEKLSDYTELYKPHFAQNEWKIKYNRLKKSSTLINYTRKNKYKDQSYGETPVLLHTKNVLALLKELTFFHKSWFTILSTTKGWTEYALYFQYLEKHNLLNEYYTQTGRSTLLDIDNSVWQLPKHYLKNVIFTPKFVLGGGGFFVVIQSWLDEEKWKPEGIGSIEEFYMEIENAILSNKSIKNNYNE
jgi:hypothetical protein